MLLFYYGNVVFITRRETNAVADSLARQAVHETRTTSLVLDSFLF